MASNRSALWRRVKVAGRVIGVLIGVFLLLEATLAFVALRNQDIAEGWKEKSDFVRAVIELFGSAIPEGRLWLLAAVGLLIVLVSVFPWGWLSKRQTAGDASPNRRSVQVTNNGNEKPAEKTPKPTGLHHRTTRLAEKARRPKEVKQLIEELIDKAPLKTRSKSKIIEWMDEMWILLNSTLRGRAYAEFDRNFVSVTRKTESLSDCRELLRLSITWLRGKLATLRNADVKTLDD